MARIGNFEGLDNPEKKNTLKEMEEKSIPSEIDRKKLDCSLENAERFKSFGETKENNAEKGKLNNTRPIKASLENKKPENMESTVDDYFKDLKSRSDCPSTIKERPFEAKDLKKLSPEETAIRRDEFDDNKIELKKQWEKENGQPWPKYDVDVYSSNGKIIRKAGGDYDAHHIQPLGMDGKNEVSNITPLHANEHYDKQGVHAPDSPYSKLEKML